MGQLDSTCRAPPWALAAPARRGWHFSPRYYCASNHIQLMTPSIVHATKRTPGSECNPTRSPNPCVYGTVMRRVPPIRMDAIPSSNPSHIPGVAVQVDLLGKEQTLRNQFFSTLQAQGLKPGARPSLQAPFKLVGERDSTNLCSAAPPRRPHPRGVAVQVEFEAVNF
jgi:hypothetical protein